jgi:hypothetical protein
MRVGGAGTGGRRVVAKFDSAQTTAENRKHWANADGLAPNAAVNPEVRRILRNRARYEVANNSYAKGIVLTLANDTIGTGPRLQMLTDDADATHEVLGELPAKYIQSTVRFGDHGVPRAVTTGNPTSRSEMARGIQALDAAQRWNPLGLRRRVDDDSGFETRAG